MPGMGWGYPCRTCSGPLPCLLSPDSLHPILGGWDHLSPEYQRLLGQVGVS